MKDVHISVRGLVEFILRRGDLTYSGGFLNKNAMLEGTRVHKKLQKSAGEGYRAEVPLKYTREYEGFILTVEGRADGIFSKDGVTFIDEIKGVYRDVNEMQEPVPVHLAQAACYAFMYGLDHTDETIKLQIRYCNMETDEVRIFVKDAPQAVLAKWFDAMLSEYYQWARHLAGWEDIRDESIQKLTFPFEYRPGQLTLVKSVYAAITAGRQLFVQAPTGVGKTMSVLYPSIQALGRTEASGIFYMTAKTVAAQVAREAVDILAGQGLKLKSLFLTAKSKLCVCDEVDCDASVCPRAKGHFNRVNEALYELLSTEDAFTREKIENTAEKYNVCPYELQSDLTDFCDAVIGDYNYAFDPAVRLKRFVADEGSSGRLIFLIDEAHNLVERARDMYSESLYLSALFTAKEALKGTGRRVANALKSCISRMEELADVHERPGLVTRTLPEDLVFSAMNLSAVLEELLSEEERPEVRTPALELYFSLRSFLNAAELMDNNYVVISVLEESGEFYVKLKCMNPAENLAQTLSGGRAAVFFSATLLPVSYYRKLLSVRTDDYAVYVESPFDKQRRLILAATDVSSLYKRRNAAEYTKFARYLLAMVCGRKGRYLAFFPSYEMLRNVADAFEEMMPFGLDCVYQNPDMTENERENFLSAFSSDTWLLGFCVTGGIFAEGIDLTGDRLIGAAVIGTGIPGISAERDLLMDFYEKDGRNGFDYAYRYPGMNKVQQAAGRVIRTLSDTGVILLLDDRFSSETYKALFPREWDDVIYTDVQNAKTEISRFWESRKQLP